MIHSTDSHRSRFVATSASQRVVFVFSVHNMIREGSIAVSVSTYCASLPPSDPLAFKCPFASFWAADHEGTACDSEVTRRFCLKTLLSGASIGMDNGINRERDEHIQGSNDTRDGEVYYM
jgi:hypothetical protein